MVVVAGGLYAMGVRSVRRAGGNWPVPRTLAFYLLGLGSFAVVTFGFLGVYSEQLRWAFTTRIALLLFVVPALVTIGRPAGLAMRALTGKPRHTVERVLTSWPIKLLGNAMFAPLLVMAAFLVFLTPLAFVIRDNTSWQWGITVVVPLVGLLMVLPMAEHTTTRTSLFITAEFMLAFLELVMDAIPGMLLRLNGTVLDDAPAVTGALPGWFPNPLHDQHLSGDALWFIAEITDVPILVVLFMRWVRTDHREAAKLDELSDEEMEALTQAHLRGHAAPQAAPRIRHPASSAEPHDPAEPP